MISFEDKAAEKAFWTEQLNEAHDFMMRVMKHPVKDCGEKMVCLKSAAENAGVEVAFSKQPHVQNLPRIFMMRQGQIDNFLQAAQVMNQRDWVMKVEDAFRNRTMQKYIGRAPVVFDAILRTVLWELEGKKPDPEFMFKRILTLTAQIPKTGTHMSGSAIDISVLNRSNCEDIDRGAPYVEFSEKTPMNSPFISTQAKRNRQEITAIMSDAGFVTYPYEFWHYNNGDAYEKILKGSSETAQYGAVDLTPGTGEVSPIKETSKPLNDLQEIEGERALVADEPMDITIDDYPVLRDKYRFTIMLKGKSVKRILSFVKTTVRNFSKKKNIVITINVDP